MELRTYDELCKFSTFDERFRYLMLHGSVGFQTFGVDRWINQHFYQRSKEWKHIRDYIIVRDSGCDLGILGRDIYDKIIIHHMNPLQVSDIRNATDILLDPQFLICVSHKTHNAIHYGNNSILMESAYVERKPFDTIPWKKKGAGK